MEHSGSMLEGVQAEGGSYIVDQCCGALREMDFLITWAPAISKLGCQYFILPPVYR